MATPFLLSCGMCLTNRAPRRPGLRFIGKKPLPGIAQEKREKTSRKLGTYLASAFKASRLARLVARRQPLFKAIFLAAGTNPDPTRKTSLWNKLALKRGLATPWHVSDLVAALAWKKVAQGEEEEDAIKGHFPARWRVFGSAHKTSPGAP